MLMRRGLPQARAFTAKAACCSACFLLTVLPAIASAGTYSGGSGTEVEPFRIGTVSDWQELMTTPADWAGHFVLTADIDLNDVPVIPIGNSTNQFTGVFDGNECVIRNVDVNMPGSNRVGLFGCLGANSQIKNLGVEDTSILGDLYVGGLVGLNQYHGTLSNCYSTGTVSGTSNYVGGISNHVGGLVGYNHGTISNCYSTATVTGSWAVGGLVASNSTRGTVTNCYSTGSVTGGSSVGGLVGVNWETISNCYSTGSVGGTGDYVGGLVGYKGGSIISSSFWDVNTAGWPTSAGGTPKTTAEMKTQSTFTSAGWDSIEVWDIGENQTYPFLRTYLAGDINHDGVVDFRDITHLAADWLGGVE